MTKRPYIYIALAVLVCLLILPATSVIYESSAGQSCARCHEIQTAYDSWHASTHRSVSCKACHGGTLTLDVAFHVNNVRRLVAHVRGDVPEQIRIRNIDAQAMLERCRSCHRQEFADWQAGPHSTTYSRIFLDKEHNRKEVLMDDCLRCHGAHFDGSIKQLVTPINTAGPWKLKDPTLANRPAIPCLACHAMHKEGQPLMKPNVQASVPYPSLELKFEETWLS